jgi:hypothetical protein
VVLGVFVVIRLFTKKVNRTSICRSIAMLLLLMLGLGDLIVGLTKVWKPTVITRTISVFFLFIFVRQIRVTFGEIARVFWKTMPIFLMIFAIIIFYTYTGFVLYSASDQDHFTTLPNAAISVFIMFTLSNYPNIGLPYYAKNRWSWFFFSSFILIGLYLFQNLLLAAIFNNYKAHL